jgi:hypothetical protein
MTQSWLHLDQEFPDPWMYPVLQAFRKAADEGSLSEPPKELGELSLHISTRFGMIKRLVARLNRRVDELLRWAQSTYTPDHVFTDRREGCALSISQDSLYDLLVDLDALLFELNAEGDLFKELLSLVHQHVGRPIPKKKLGESLLALLKASGSDPQWFLRLDAHRNFFAHSGSPYVAIDITKDPWELLIVKSNVKRFDDPNSFFPLEEVNQIVQGFLRDRGVFQEYLVSLCLPSN